MKSHAVFDGGGISKASNEGVAPIRQMPFPKRRRGHLQLNARLVPTLGKTFQEIEIPPEVQAGSCFGYNVH